ncbi:MAG: endopeptidase La [Oscillospiraceae bacterium]|jgi:ATP-dependent Lon protease|nr:endopeptidase La [Oscillospiraceae bacterium]
MEIIEKAIKEEAGKINEYEIYSDRIVPIVALRGMVMFPGMMLHFDIGRRKSILALEDAMKNGQDIFITAQKDVKIDDPDTGDIYDVGVGAKVRQIIHQPGGVARALVEGCNRSQVAEIIAGKPFMKAKIKVLEEIKGRKSVPCKALARKIKDMFVEYLNLSPRMPPDLVIGIHAIKDTGQLADFIASNIPLDFEDKQRILEELNEDSRLEMTIVYLAKEFDILKIENDLAVQLKDSIDKRQKEYFLREQMKVISEELGEEEDPRSDSEKYIKKIKSLKLKKENSNKLYEEVERFARIPTVSGESGMIRNYLDFCISLPWNKLSKENWDIEKAESILAKDHYGLEDVKERIIEFLAARKLAKIPSSQILCLVGPPGIGKTSIAESLARAIGRKYARISLGGVRDEAEIRGHRKTYIGAMPGCIISAVKKVRVRNPLILLDEIDKLSKDYHGDPGAALLETLDPEQNKAFCDHFVDLDFDLSETFFVATANDKSKIPDPLADRMEIINLYSYTHEEKFNIATRHLIPKQLKKNGLNVRNFVIEDSALRVLIDGYTREAGVRELERKIASLMRKTAKLIVMGKEKKIKIDENNLKKMLGPKKFKREDEAKENGEIGIVRGLAWTAVGGETMPIEVSLMKGKGKLHITGSLGDVMKESAKLAVSYIRSNSEKLGISNDFYSTMDIHIHAPEGAVPKDGPSAGVTMTTALVSALSSVPARQDVAMTGEITLKGRVLPIGGLKEKTMAAYRAGVKTVIIPSGNESDLVSVDVAVKKAINFVMADNLDTVLKEALI